MLNLCARCNRAASNMAGGWGTCVTCGRLLCPEDIVRGCDGVVPAALATPGALALGAEMVGMVEPAGD